jgi:hypothetical protein
MGSCFKVDLPVESIILFLWRKRQIIPHIITKVLILCKPNRGTWPGYIWHISVVHGLQFSDKSMSVQVCLFMEKKEVPSGWMAEVGSPLVEWWGGRTQGFAFSEPPPGCLQREPRDLVWESRAPRSLSIRGSSCLIHCCHLSPVSSGLAQLWES